MIFAASPEWSGDSTASGFLLIAAAQGSDDRPSNLCTMIREVARQRRGLAIRDGPMRTCLNAALASLAVGIVRCLLCQNPFAKQVIAYAACHALASFMRCYCGVQPLLLPMKMLLVREPQGQHKSQPFDKGVRNGFNARFIIGFSAKR
jgi:hypothetical protein